MVKKMKAHKMYTVLALVFGVFTAVQMLSALVVKSDALLTDSLALGIQAITYTANATSEWLASNGRIGIHKARMASSCFGLCVSSVLASILFMNTIYDLLVLRYFEVSGKWSNELQRLHTSSDADLVSRYRHPWFRDQRDVIIVALFTLLGIVVDACTIQLVHGVTTPNVESVCAVNQATSENGPSSASMDDGSHGLQINRGRTTRPAVTNSSSHQSATSASFKCEATKSSDTKLRVSSFSCNNIDFNRLSSLVQLVGDSLLSVSMLTECGTALFFPFAISSSVDECVALVATAIVLLMTYGTSIGWILYHVVYTHPSRTT